MDVLFLDANVLVAAAWKEDARVRRLWDLLDVELVTSAYAAGEALRNLTGAERRARYAAMTKSLRIVPEPGEPGRTQLPGDISLPEDDRPILLAAIEAGATHLITGDFRHFGGLFGREVRGVLVLPPAEYLRSRDTG